MNELEKVLKALANKRRLTILQYLKRNKEGSVGEIARSIRLSVKATSKHLRILFMAGIIERTQKSLQGLYRLSPIKSAATRHIVDLL